MIKLTNKKRPQKQYIINNKNEICYILGVFFCLLLIICFTKMETFSLFDMSIIITVLLSQLATMYSCFIKWNPDTLMYNHYLFVIVIYLVILFSSNIWLLGYYLLVVISIVIGWNIKQKCVFDKLCWDIECCGFKYTNTDESSQIMVYMLLAIFPLKMCYLNK